MRWFRCWIGAHNWSRADYPPELVRHIRFLAYDCSRCGEHGWFRDRWNLWPFGSRDWKHDKNEHWT